MSIKKSLIQIGKNKKISSLSVSEYSLGHLSYSTRSLQKTFENHQHFQKPLEIKEKFF